MIRLIVASQYEVCLLYGIATSRPAGGPVRIRFEDWIGRPPTRTESASYARALARLEAKGAVKKLRGRRVQLTAVGWQMQNRFAEQHCLPFWGRWLEEMLTCGAFNR